MSYFVHANKNVSTFWNIVSVCIINTCNCLALQWGDDQCQYKLCTCAEFIVRSNCKWENRYWTSQRSCCDSVGLENEWIPLCTVHIFKVSRGEDFVHGVSFIMVVPIDCSSQNNLGTWAVYRVVWITDMIHYCLLLVGSSTFAKDLLRARSATLTPVWSSLGTLRERALEDRQLEASTYIYTHTQRLIRTAHAHIAVWMYSMYKYISGWISLSAFLVVLLSWILLSSIFRTLLGLCAFAWPSARYFSARDRPSHIFFFLRLCACLATCGACHSWKWRWVSAVAQMTSRTSRWGPKGSSHSLILGSQF